MDYKEKVIALLNSQELSDEQKRKIEKIFPELKESEDEFIREKLIIRFLGYDDEESFGGIKIKDIIAWLEKRGEQKARYHDVCDKCTRQPTCQSDCFLQQGEQKPAECSRVPLREMVLNVWELGNIWKEITRGVCNTEHGTQLDYIVKHWKEGEHYIKSFEKQGEQKPYGQRKECTDCQFNYAGECKGYCAMKRSEQKPAWSEEDQKIASRIASVLEEAVSEHAFMSTKRLIGDKEVIEIEGWLKSLEDRVQPKPKQDWSDEDKRIIDNLISQLGNLYARKLIKEETKDKYVNWLKSLRPQNMWKPSDEQMIAINTAINVIGKGTLNGKQLIELQEQLKKL